MPGWEENEKEQDSFRSHNAACDGGAFGLLHAFGGED